MSLTFSSQTTVRAPVPRRFLAPTEPDEYKQFIRTLYSVHAHPVYIAFNHPMYGVRDILDYRDDYLDHKLSHLETREVEEPVYPGDEYQDLLDEWSLDPQSMWGKEWEDWGEE